MTASVQDLLQKISYFEAEIEIQKQILFSLTSEEKDEIEDTLSKIKKSKVEIENLRNSIRQVSPEEYQRIITLEEALEKFKAIAADSNFQAIDHMAPDVACTVTTLDNEVINCLLRAKDDKGNFTIITPDGQILTISSDQVSSTS